MQSYPLGERPLVAPDSAFLLLNQRDKFIQHGQNVPVILNRRDLDNRLYARWLDDGRLTGAGG